MGTLRLARLAPLAGVAFVAAAGTVVALEGDEPAESATTPQLVAHWADRADTALLGAFLAIAAALALLTFAASLRARLRSGEPGEATASLVAFAGATVAAAGVLTSAMVSLAAADAADEARADAVPALNALAQAAWLPITGGLATLLVAAGIGGLRSAALPAWLAWPAVVIGLAFLTPAGLVAFLVAPIWLLATSVVLYRRESATPATARPAHTLA
jgi:hypothetical protein